jgi:L-aspartate oxidase
VFGALAGAGASQAAEKVPDTFQVLPLENLPVQDGGEPLDLADIRNSLKSLMWRSCGVRRDAARLHEAAEDIDHWCRYVLPRQFTDPKGWELQNMLSISRLMIQAALDREETRGVHVRMDFPDTDDEHWRRHIAFRQVSA